VISSVTIQRLGSAAQAFNPLAQVLPTVTAPKYSLTNINPSSGTGSISINQPPRSLLRLYRTLDLSSWGDLGYLYLDRNASPLSSINIGGVISGVPKQFFRIPITTYPENAIAPGSLAGRILTVQTTDFGAIMVQFFNNGGGVVAIDGGTYQITEYKHDPEGYSAAIVIYTNGLLPLRFKPAYDTESTTHYGGRVSADYYHTVAADWIPMGGTGFTLTK
jgi:hypothetical protein